MEPSLPDEAVTREMYSPQPGLHFPRPNTSQSFLDLTLLGLFVILGTSGNMIVIVVYIRNLKRKQSTANHFLCSLALTDLMVCMILIPIHIYLEITMMERRIQRYECKITMVFWHQTLLCSSWILVGISVDRYYSLCKPLKMSIHGTFVRRLLFFIWVFSVLIALPVFAYYDGPGCDYIPVPGTPLRVSLVITTALLTLVLPLTIIIGAYTSIFCLLSKRNRTAMNQIGRGRLMHQTRYKVAKRLLLVIIVYIFCWLPRTILELYFAFNHADHATRTTFTIYVWTWIIPYMNSVLNPLLYSLINPTFRDQCWKILHCDCSKPIETRRGSVFNRASSSFRHNGSLKTKTTWV